MIASHNRATGDQPSAEAAAQTVIPLNAVAGLDTALVGTKAGTLGRLRRAGFPVPDGFVVIAAANLRAKATLESVSRHLDELGNPPVAVRSSAAAEDLSGASFAGQYETVLGVQGLEAVLGAITRVRASGGSERVAHYQPGHEPATADVQPAALVQRLIPADAAGVAFTADPLTGDRDRTVVSAVRGLGERLVAGESDADEWSIEGGIATRRHAAAASIESAMALAVAELARRVEVHERSPQDIEWAAASGELYLLQARPMTALPEPVTWDPGLPGIWARDFRLGEWLGDPVTPLFEDWPLTRLEARANGYFARLLGMPLPRPLHVVVNGWYFYGFNFVPTRRPALLWMMVRHVLPRLVLRPRRVAMAFPPLAWLGIGLAEREWRTDMQPRYGRLVTEAERMFDTADARQLIGLVDNLADAAGDYFVSLMGVAGYASKTEFPLARFYRAHIEPMIGGTHLDLLAGLGQEAPAPAPHAVRGLDWFEPTLGETGAIPDSARVAARHAVARGRRTEAEARARAALAGHAKLLASFEKLLAAGQRFALLREEIVAEFTLPWPVLRRAVLRLGGILVKRGVLEGPEEVFFLTHQELLAAVGGETAELGARSRERRRTWESQRRLVPPLRLGQMPPMFESLVRQAEEAVRGPAPSIGDGLVGIPASSGRATGPVRVVRSMDEFGRVEPGDVLVCPVTAPAWTPVFDRIAAVVTDTGGVAAHASIVAREYGLPAVVGTGDATARLRDGEPVEVDGSAGVVRRLAPPG